MRATINYVRASESAGCGGEQFQKLKENQVKNLTSIISHTMMTDLVDVTAAITVLQTDNPFTDKQKQTILDAIHAKQASSDPATVGKNSKT